MPYMNDIIQRIRDLMTYKGLNISDTAKLVGISQPNLSSILAGKRPIGDNVLNKFVLAFKVNKKWLLSGDGDMLQQADITSLDVSKTQFKEHLEKMLSSLNYLPPQSIFNLHYKLLNGILGEIPKEQVNDALKNSKALQEFYNVIGEKKYEPIPFDRTRIVTEKIGIPTPEITELRHEIEKQKAEIEHLKENLRLKDTVIQAKDELIKLLAEKINSINK